MDAVRDAPVPVFENALQRERLVALLRTCRFDDAGLAELFSVRDLHALPDQPGPVLQHCMAGDPALQCLARLFVLQMPVDPGHAEAVLGTSALDTLFATGLVAAEPRGVLATVLLQPAEGLLLASDRRDRRHPGCADFVLEAGPSSRWVAAHALRDPVDSTLDLGSGSGYLACLAAAHSTRVTATDVSARAVGFSRFNALLNGLDDIECLHGDLFGSVRRRRFDRIVCNSPFVLSPETGFRYRDHSGDFYQRLFGAAAGHLTERGVLQASYNWGHAVGRNWRDDLRAWFGGMHCDVWILRAGTLNPAHYSLLWLEATGRSEDAGGREMQRWLQHFRDAGIQAVSAGVVTMRRVDGRQPWFEISDAPAYDWHAGETVARALRARSMLAAIDDATTLLGQVLRRVPDLRMRTDWQTDSTAWRPAGLELELTRGLHYAIRIDPVAAEFLGYLDGRRSAREAAQALAADRLLPVEKLLPGLPRLLRRLLLRGLIEVADDSAAPGVVPGARGVGTDAVRA